MDDTELESLAVKEIIAEIEKKKQLELESQKPAHRQIRPNKRFLGRTINSVLQHNKRQHAEERRKSWKKLEELNERSERISRFKNLHRPTVNDNPPERYQQVEPQAYSNEAPVNLAWYLLLNDANQIPKNVTKKKQSDILTIDLTKKKKRHKEKKRKKRKIQKKKTKHKKIRRRRDSSSSSSSSSTCPITSSDSESSSDEVASSPALLIDLT